MSESAVSETGSLIARLLEEALAQHRAGDLASAERIYADILGIEDANPQVLTLLGTLRAQRGDFKQALQLLVRSLKIDQRQPFALNSLGNALHAMKRHDEAVVQYERAIVLKPDHVAYANRGNALTALDRHADALESYDRAIALDPSYAEAHSKRGDVLRELKRYEDAILSYEAALARRPGAAQDHFSRALALEASGHGELAIAAYQEAIVHRPDFAEAYNNRGNALRALGRSQEALEQYEAAIRLNSNYVTAHYSCGNTLRSLGRYEEALARFQDAARLEPKFVEAHRNCGHILRLLNRHNEALTVYHKAIEADPSYAEGHRYRGDALRKLNRYEEAVGSYDRAIALNEDAAAAYVGRGLALKALKRDQAALASYDRAVALRPDDRAAHYYRAIVLRDMERLDEALTSIAKTIELDPEFPYASGQFFTVKMHMCDWDGLREARRAVLGGIESGSLAAVPFQLQLIDCGLDVQRKCAELCMAGTPVAEPSAALRSHDESRDGRIRVAYLSADFHAHATAYLMAGVFEQHDRARFETFGISFGPDDGSTMRARVKEGFDHFFEARNRDDRDVAALLRERHIDIAVDLKGHTRDARPRIFALRPVPIQVTYLGFPGTSGVSYFDYLIADRIVVPEEHQPHYTEKLVYLPDTYQCNDSKRPIGSTATSRADFGLPDEGFVFCCFNHNFKITPEIFDVWMRILRQTDGSVLWLLRSNPAAERNLRREAESRNVSGARLIFAAKLPYADHLARLRLADLFLDTLPYGAHTTASDALWGGAPVVTCMGSAFAGRVGASLLNAVGLPEMVTHSLDGYEALSLTLARDPALLAGIKAKLARNRGTYPLFDTVRFTRHLETAYARMVERHRRGEPPEAFAVEALDNPHG